MKSTEFRKLIAEEVRKALNELGPREDNLGVAKGLIGKTIKDAKMGTMGSVVLQFTDGTKLQLSSKNIGRDKDPNLTIIQ